MVEWLEEYPVPPSSRDPTMQLFPPGLEPRVPFSSASLIRSEHLLHNMVRALDGKEIVQDGYDSDDEPTALVGMRVGVRWSGGKWFAGLVDDYDPATGQHHVLYDDHEEKWYNMSAKTFRVLGSGVGHLDDDDLDSLSGSISSDDDDALIDDLDDVRAAVVVAMTEVVVRVGHFHSFA